MENCQACRDNECSLDSLKILENACTDGLSLASLMSDPLSTSTDTNDLIKTVNSEYSYQLAELTLFQYPNTAESEF